MRALPIVLLVLLIAGGLAVRGIGARDPGLDPQQESLASSASLPSGAIELLAAHPFVVDEPFVHEWRAEKPSMRAGYLLALEVDPELARPRQTYEAVLYVGAQTAERCNAPMQGGRLIVLVPAELDAHGRVALDLDTAPIWFGSLELPERVDAARIQDELALALQHGIGPATPGPDYRAPSSADGTIHVRSRSELQPYVEDLIARFSVR